MAEPQQELIPQWLLEIMCCPVPECRGDFGVAGGHPSVGVLKVWAALPYPRRHPRDAN